MADDYHRESHAPTSGDSHQINHEAPLISNTLFNNNHDCSVIDPSLHPNSCTATQASVGYHYQDYSSAGPNNQAGNPSFEGHHGYEGFHYGAPVSSDDCVIPGNVRPDIDRLNQAFVPTPPGYTGLGFDNFDNRRDSTFDAAEREVPPPPAHIRPSFDDINNDKDLTFGAPEHEVLQPPAYGRLSPNNTTRDGELKFVFPRREVRYRTKFNTDQLAHLKAAWHINRNPTSGEKQRLATLLGKNRKVIDTWFSHRRRQINKAGGRGGRYVDLYPEAQAANAVSQLLPALPAVAYSAVNSPGPMDPSSGSIHPSITSGSVTSDQSYDAYYSNLIAFSGTKAAIEGQPLNNGPGNAFYSQQVQAQCSEYFPNNSYSAPLNTAFAEIRQAEDASPEQVRLNQIMAMEYHLIHLKERISIYLPTASFRWEKGETLQYHVAKEQQRLYEYGRLFEDISRLIDILEVHRENAVILD